MDEVLKFLQDNSPFFLATVDGDVPKVRPFGLAIKFEGKLYFGTNNKKPVYQQLQVNPKIEISTASKTGEWLRLKGNAVFNTTPQIKQAALDAVPMLKNVYSVEDSLFELFYIEDAEATLKDMKGASKTITF